MVGVNASTGSLLRNALSQIGGRLFLSIGRLGVALLIVRSTGAERYGEYALVINFVVLFEWLTDFGQTDIGVRDICQEPERRTRVLRELLSLKLMMGAALTLLLPVTLMVLRYPADIVAAGAVGAAGLLCYGTVQVYRTIFRAGMTMDRDVLAESGGLVVMVPLTWAACRADAGLAVLVGCYTLSRVVFLILAVWFGRHDLPAGTLALARTSGRDLIALARRAAPLGVAGLLVAVYDSLAVVVLSKFADLQAVAQYSAATRYVYPVIIIVASLNSAFYPPLAAAWRPEPDRFAELQQSALTLSMLVGGGAFVAIHAGAPFLMGLMGPEIGAAADILRLMTWVVLARSVTTAMSPLIIIAGHQAKALWITAAALVLQLAALFVVVPRFGLFGAVGAYLAIELALGVVPISLIGQRVTGVRLRVGPPLKLVGCAVVAVWTVAALPVAGSLAAAILAGLFYTALALVSGAVLISDIRGVLDTVLRRRRELPVSLG
jgi:O-antigen/teichoic acid export membrane protein